VQRLLAARSQHGQKIPDPIIAAAAGQRCEWVLTAGTVA